MDFSDHHSPFMGALRPFAAHTDAIAVHPQFPMNNEQFNPHSQLEETRAFKRARISETNQFNAIPRAPMNPMKPQPNLPPMNPMKPQPNVPVNKGTSHLFFKTRMCAKFKTGMCRNGENCNFAHGVEDLRKPPPNWQELVGVRDENRSSGNWDDDQKIIQKMKLCKKYCNGQECPYGERCNFLHEDPAKFRDDSGRFREASTTSIGSTIGSPKSRLNNSNNLDNNNRPLNNTGFDVPRTNPNPNPKSTYWKTKLCIKWEITGQCPFGDKCHFAHGQAELQLPAGRIEAEATGFTSLPTTVISESDAATDVSPTIAATGVPPAPNLEEQGKKCLLKWKRSKKINQIYGDWLDDMPLVSNLPRIVKS